MARYTQDSSHLLGRCLASAANAGPALTPPPFLACCVCWAKRTTVDHVLIWCLDIFPAVARHYTNSRRRVLHRCYFSVGSASSIVDQRWTESKIIFFPQQAQGVESLWRWFGVVDSGPALNRRCFHPLVSGVLSTVMGGGPRVVVSTAAFHARVRGSVPGLGGLKETKMFLPHPRVKVSIVGSLRDREVACSASDRQGSNFESCVWRTVSSQSSHHPQEVLLAQFSLYVHKGGLKPDSFHFSFCQLWYHTT